ncbi:MAG: hypothetical protein R3242_04240 [Akkermansiaceae bacterium]|nr:hypothetical protein [Akkermansiaceae bacterium]
MSESDEIEVEVVEVGESRPIQRKPEPRTGDRRGESPFTDRMPRVRQIRIPGYLWPLAIILGLLIFFIALVFAILILIPFLVLRAILRLFRV